MKSLPLLKRLSVIAQFGYTYLMNDTDLKDLGLFTRRCFLWLSELILLLEISVNPVLILSKEIGYSTGRGLPLTCK